MKLSSMRYKNYTWPHNPKTFVVEYRRQIAAQKVPMGGCILQDLGVNCRILRGEGEFAGPDAYEEFKTLADVFCVPVRDGGAEAGLCALQLCFLGR